MDWRSRRMLFRGFLLAALALPAACTDRGNYPAYSTHMEQAPDAVLTSPAAIFLSEGDVKAPYQTLGDVQVRVTSPTPLHPRPSVEELNTALRDAAADLGAEAVIHVKYNRHTVREVEFLSQDASGTAIRFLR